MGSPLDTDLVNKKRLKVFAQPTKMVSQNKESQIPIVPSSQIGPIKDAQGLNLMSSVVTCDEGMSP